MSTIVKIITPGPQGPAVEPLGNSGSLQYNNNGVIQGIDNVNYDPQTNHLTVTGSFTVSGSNTFTVIGPTVLSTIEVTGTSGIKQGLDTTVVSDYGAAQGFQSDAKAPYSHAEGFNSRTIAEGAHAEGESTLAAGNYSHTEGAGTRTTGEASHAEGVRTTAKGTGSHAEGRDTEAYGDYSHASGFSTQAYGQYQTVVGQYNTLNNSTDLFVVGGGSSTERRDVVAVKSGSVVLSGSIYISGALYLNGSAVGGLVSGSQSGSNSGSFSGSFTGSFSGSFSGSLSGSSSFATSASYASTASYATVFNAGTINATSVITSTLSVQSQPILNVAAFGTYITGSTSYSKNTEYSLELKSIPFLEDPAGVITLDAGSDYKQLVVTRQGYYNILVQATYNLLSLVEDFGYLGIRINGNVYQGIHFNHLIGSLSDNNQYKSVTFNTIVHLTSGTDLIEVVTQTKSNDFRIKENTVIGTSAPASYVFITSV